jgi:hypothetical protein
LNLQYIEISSYHFKPYNPICVLAHKEQECLYIHIFCYSKYICIFRICLIKLKEMWIQVILYYVPYLELTVAVARYFPDSNYYII